MAFTPAQATQAGTAFAGIFGGQQVGQPFEDANGLHIVLHVGRDRASVVNFISNTLIPMRGRMSLTPQNIGFNEAPSNEPTNGDLTITLHDPQQLAQLIQAFGGQQAALRQDVATMLAPAAQGVTAPAPSAPVPSAPQAAPQAAASQRTAPQGMRVVAHVGHSGERLVQLLEEDNRDQIGPGKMFESHQAFHDWFFQQNQAAFVTLHNKCNPRDPRTWQGIRAEQEFIVPEGFNLERAGLANCGPSRAPTRRTPAPAAAAPAPALAPVEQPATPRPAFQALPQHISPTQLQQIRIQANLLGEPSLLADAPARRRFDQEHAAGAWQGRDQWHADGLFGPIGSSIGSVVSLLNPALTAASFVGSTIGTIVDGATINDTVRVGPADLPGRQPNAETRVNSYEGWHPGPDGIPVRDNPDLVNQPDATHLTGGLVSGRISDAVRNPNNDIATQSQLSDALVAPNVRVGQRVIAYLQPQIVDAYTRFHEQPTQANGQRVLNLVAAAAQQDVAQMSGSVDVMANMQQRIIAEAAAAQPSVTLTGYDLYNPDSIPDLTGLGVTLTPLPGRVQAANDPGFMNSYPGMTVEEAIAAYDRTWGGTNLNSFASYGRTRQNTVTREIGAGGVVTPTTEEARQIAARVVGSTGPDGIINRSPESRAAFRDLVINDAASDHPHQFTLLVNKSLNDMVHHPEMWGFTKPDGSPDRDAAILYASSMVGEQVVRNQYLQRTATPEPDSAGRTRDEAAAAAGFRQAAPSDARLQDFLQRISTHPIDPHAPQENPPGGYAQGIVHQLALQGPNEPGFHAIANANPPLSAAARAQFHDDVTRMASYELWVSNAAGRPVENTPRPESVRRTQTDAMAARDVRPFTAIGPDGQPLPGQVITTGFATHDEAVIAIQAARARGDVEGATRLAVQDMMAHPETAASAIGAAGAFDRTVLTNVVLESMARNPQAFDAAMDEVRKSQRTSFFFGLFHSDGERGEFVADFERAAGRYRDLIERRNAGEHVSDEDFANARRDLAERLTQIDAMEGRSAPREVATDRYIDPDHPNTTYIDLPRGERGHTEVGADGRRYIYKHFDYEERRMVREQVRDEQHNQARQFQRAVAGQDTLLAIAQSIGSHPDSNRTARDVVQQMITGAIVSSNPTITGSRVAGGFVDASIADMGEQNMGGQGRSIAVRPDGAAGIVDATTGYRDSIAAGLRQRFSSWPPERIAAALSPNARTGSEQVRQDAAQVQAAIVALNPAITDGQMAAIQAQVSNVGSGSAIDSSGVPTRPGYLTGDIWLIIAGAIVASIPGGRDPRDPSTPTGGLDHRGIPRDPGTFPTDGFPRPPVGSGGVPRL